jgi:hypothetical protein
MEEGSAVLIPGLDLPADVDLVAKPTGVDMGGPQVAPLKQMLFLMMLSLIWCLMMVSNNMWLLN